MRIGIDLRPMLAAGLGRGLRTYTINLVKNLLAIDRRNHYSLFISRTQQIDDVLEQVGTTQHIHVVKLKRPTRNIFFWDQVCWYRVLKQERIDLFHSLVYGIPFVCPCKRVLTIHDLTPLIFPEFVKKFRHRAVFRLNFFSGKFADRIITASQHSKQDLIQYLKIPAHRISIIADGVNARYKNLQNMRFNEEIARRYHIPGKFLLYVGGFDDNKNLPTLVTAFQQLLQKESIKDEYLFLVFVGTLNPAAEILRKFVKTTDLEKRVIFTGFVPEDDLIALYNAAELFVFPSLYEGFGLPPLEAMACGTAVISSNASSLPEVVGDAAIQVNPHSPEELGQAILHVLSNPELRQQMEDKGLIRAKLFSWEETARQTLQVYEEIGEKK